MIRQFTYPPATFIAESRHASLFWYLVLPLLVIPLLFYIAVTMPDFFMHWMASEQTGLLEFINALFPLIVALIALRLLVYPFIWRDKLLRVWMILMVVGGIYLAGEEASWGQHYVGWTTPEFWTEVNDQQETNLHNTSSWLDQKPRLVLTVGMIVSTLIFPIFLIFKPHMPMRQFDFVYPPLALIPLAVILFFTELYKQLKRVLPDHWITNLRPGELQEVYIVWFLLAYALILWRRARIVAEDEKKSGQDS